MFLQYVIFPYTRQLKTHKTEDEIRAFKHISEIKDRRKELEGSDYAVILYITDYAGILYITRWFLKRTKDS